ncbi:DUF480 domain-containing protein [Nocardioides sp.]|uniref:DUF480 domain-containing protein n=1 Tax=Nocardioides sp. TaxID=35761 RepID=UPI0026120D32|nr:DUF480 domain-containing protein [Nocardioides sp.]
MADLAPDLQLTPTEQRVLGSLLEKQVTVPASYPLTLSALRTACNQTSSREPVMDLAEQEVEQTAKGLKDKGVLRIVWSDTGRRTLKYHQVLTDVLDLEDDERALLTVLLLRGPQAPGELRTRTERLHAFDGRDDAESCLVGMAERGLVRQLDRRPGDRDHRWVHLLGPSGTPDPTPAAQVDREAPIADSPEARDERVRATYAAVAEVYAETLTGELDHLPFERWLLERVAAEADGPVVEVGCGPGHVTAHLAALGADARGLDLTPEMVEQARRRYPQGRYDVGDLRRLMRPESAAGWGAVLAWYSLIHLADSELPGALEALVRPLVPGGLLVLAMQAGDDVRRINEWHGVEGLGLDLVHRDPDAVLALVAAAGLTDVEWFVRGPLSGRGETARRLYVLARRP